MLAGVGAREAKVGAVTSEQCADGGVVELTAIVCLQGENGQLKLCPNVGIEIEENSKNIRFLLERKGPDIVSEIVQNNQIEFIAVHTNNR